MSLSRFSLRGRLALALIPFGLLLAAFAPAQSVVGWGDGTYGAPNPPAGLKGVIQIAAGGHHALALESDGTVAAWGSNNHGQTTVPSGLSNVTGISAGANHSLALKADGTVVAWGYDSSGQCDVPAGLSSVAQVSAGAFHSLAVRSDGTVAAWGFNVQGQTTVPAGLTGVVGVAGGGYHSLALKSNGTVVAWGYPAYGQCQVPTGLSGVVQIAAGQFHSLALKSDGTVVGWGDDSFGQTDVPEGVTGVVQIAAGDYNSLAVKSDGTVVVWGNNDDGQCNVPAGLTGVLQAGEGPLYSLALKAAASATLDQAQVYGGYSATGTVTLADPAGAGGTAVSLVSDDDAVHIPASVTVPEGATSATFPVTTDLFFGPDRNVTVRTSFNGTATVPFKLRLKGQGVALAFDHPSVVGGSTTRVTMKLTLLYAPPVDLAFALTGDSSLTLPPSVTLPTGATSAGVVVTPSPLHGPSQAEGVNALYQGRVVATGTLQVQPIKATVSFDSPTILSGTGGSGLLYLNAAVKNALTVDLTSSDPNLTVPSTVVVAANSRYVAIPFSTTPVAKVTVVHVTATIFGNSFSGTIRLAPIPEIASVTLPASMYGNGHATGTVRLKSAAPKGGGIAYLSSADASLSVPPSVVVPEGQYAATFDVYSSDVFNPIVVAVTAKSGGSSKLASISVNPLSVSSLSLSAASVQGGSDVTATVALNTPVAFDTVVSLASGDPLATVPATVTIPAGSRVATFTITTTRPATAKNVKITASKNGTSAYRTLKVTP